MSASVSDRHDSAHDPICPTVRYPDDHCQCHLIAWAREDERDNCWSAVADLSATEFWEEVLVELPGGGLGRRADHHQQHDPGDQRPHWMANRPLTHD